MERVGIALLSLALLVGCGGGEGRDVTLLNVSYDPTRELWRDLNENFVEQFEKEAGKKIAIKQSHGGSGTQARAVIDGLDADIVTLAMHSDIDAIRKKGLIADDWQKRLPNDSLPYYSTIVFVVRKGNPKEIKDWPDLIKPGVEIITPNPRTSGNGQLSLYAAWGSVATRGGTEAQAADYLTKLYQQVLVLDSGARGSSTTFAQRKIGDVHLAWENEAKLEAEASARNPTSREAKDQLELVYPPISIRAEPFVAVVDRNVDRKGTRAAAEAYLRFLYTDRGQTLLGKHFYRPINPAILKQYADAEFFPELTLFSITDIAKDWADAHRKLVGEGSVFDTIYRPKGKG